mmetsp:Transcript_12630/g.36756  ORF Transcript_12630/g.36756 Transcript_12630/m.36756 type:complete len:249 (+) Transcript_12630:4095-4841(+)
MTGLSGSKLSSSSSTSTSLKACLVFHVRLPAMLLCFTGFGCMSSRFMKVIARRHVLSATARLAVVTPKFLDTHTLPHRSSLICASSSRSQRYAVLLFLELTSPMRLLKPQLPNSSTSCMLISHSVTGGATKAVRPYHTVMSSPCSRTCKDILKLHGNGRTIVIASSSRLVLPPPPMLHVSIVARCSMSRCYSFDLSMILLSAPRTNMSTISYATNLMQFYWNPSHGMASCPSTMVSTSASRATIRSCQ